jgi:type I restriction enzyme, S subunit
MSRYLRVDHGWFAYNPMRINVGSIGWAEHPEQTGIISPDYVVFSCSDRIEARLLYLFLRSAVGLRAINLETAGPVRERLYFDSLARIGFPLPPRSEQERIVARIEDLSIKINEVRGLREQQERDVCNLLLSAFWRVSRTVPRLPMGKVAPVVRRPVDIDVSTSYPELGIRSFGNGTFHKPALSGSELGSKRIFKIEAGDLLFSNVFAWEGAIAVARPEDTGRFGSHRFITCVPKKQSATSHFLCFYFLTNEGLELIRAASAGGAGRNRTLGLEALANIAVPVPSLDAQIWFDSLQSHVTAMKKLQGVAAAELYALIPSILDRAFNGEL